MATAAQVEMTLARIHGIPPIRSWDDILGSGWALVVCVDDSAWWIHKSGKVLPSSRNWGKE